MRTACWLLSSVVLGSLVGCGVDPGGGTYTPLPSATPTPSADPSTPGVTAPPGISCDVLTDIPGGVGVLDLPASVAVGVPAVIGAGQTGGGELYWLACGPEGAVVWARAGAWVGLELPKDGLWRVFATREGEVLAAGELRARVVPGERVMFDLGQIGPTLGGKALGALPWPSELYRDGEGGPLLLSESSIFDWMPDSVRGISPFTTSGIQKGWASMEGFPVGSALLLRTEDTADASGLPTEPEAFTREGAPVLLMKLVDGRVDPAAARLPLVWSYVESWSLTTSTEGGASQSVPVPRDRLSLSLPPGTQLEEGAEYLWLVTTRAAGADGPWGPSAGFESFMAGPLADEPAEATTLRALVVEAAALLPDVPGVEVVAGAGWFKTRRFSDALDQVFDCAREGRCQGVDLTEVGAWPSAQPTFPVPSHVYWDTPPDLPTTRGHRDLALLMDAPALEGEARLYLSAPYRLVAFGTLPSVNLKGPMAGPGGDPDLAVPDVIGQEADGRVRAINTTTLRFTLLLPKAPPPAGWTRHPVVVFLHGLSQDQSDVFKAGEFLASQGFALVAIDQLAHGSRYEVPSANVDVVNNLLTREATRLGDEGLAAEAAGPPWSTGGDGLSDARVSSGYEVTSVLAFFEGLTNFRAMGDNFRQIAVDLAQVDEMLAAADATGGLNHILSTQWGATGVATDRPFLHGRSLGSIGLGVFLAHAPEERAAVLGVPGGGVATWLASRSPYVGSLITQFAKVAVACGTSGCASPDVVSDLLLQSPVAEEFLGPDDPFTLLIQGLLEAGDPLALSPRLSRAHRDGPAHLLLQHVCDDEVVPNPSTYAWGLGIGLEALDPVQVWPALPVVPAGAVEADFPTYALDPAAGGAYAGTTRRAVSANVDGATQVLLSYCPGSHAGLYDRPEVNDERYAYYPDGPFPHGAPIVFPPLQLALPVENAWRDSRDGAINFLVTAASGLPVATAPALPQRDDLDADGLEAADDPCPLGPNQTWWLPEADCEEEPGGIE